MFWLILLAFVVVPVAELAVIVQVADGLGLGVTIVLLLAVSLTGSWLVRREGLGVARRVRAQLAAGELPTDDVLDGFLVLLAGALLLTPGFITDAVGLGLLVPPVRAPVRAALRSRFGRRLAPSGGQTGAGGAGGAVFTAAWSSSTGPTHGSSSASSGQAQRPRIDLGRAVIVDGSTGHADGRDREQGS